ncbi:hypothetical protein ATERTT37_002432 [Aspergillus terreus]
MDSRPQGGLSATNTNEPTSPGISLHDAATEGLTETVRWLLDRGVPVDHTDDKNATALHLAIKEGHVDTVRLLLARNADIESPYGPIQSKPVHMAATTLNPALMEAVLEYKPSLESRCNGLTALYIAIAAGNEDVVRLLLEAGADAKARTTCEVGTGESVLHMAVGWFHNSMLALLIRYGADVNVAGTNPIGQTALHIAAEYGNTEAITELIKYGTNINAKFPDGQTALEVAAQKGQIEAVSVLIDHGMDPLAKFDGKQNAIYMSVIHGKKEMVEWFLDRYTDRMDHMTKLNLAIAAAGTNRIKILEMLDKRGYPIIEVDDHGITGLFLALHFKHYDAVVYLLRRGADPEPQIPKDPNSWVSKDPDLQKGHDLLRSAKSQRGSQPNSELFPEWRYKEEEDTSASFQARLMAGATSSVP